MPNTLVHIGLQTLISRPILSDRGDFSCILLGCVIPDIPWVLRRIVAAISPGTDPYTLLAYATVQASLFVCIIAAVACSTLFIKRLRAAVILSAGSLLHLVLDALQFKWGNGVNLLAPFDWQLWNRGYVWPESAVIYAATMAGVAVFVVALRNLRSESGALLLTRKSLAAAIVVGLGYVFSPVMFLNGPISADAHYLQTLQSPQRAGKTIELDRDRVSAAETGWVLRTFAGETLSLQNFEAPVAGIYSIRGRFDSNTSIVVNEWHRHSTFRDHASRAGLALICVWFVAATWINLRSAATKEDPGRPPD